MQRGFAASFFFQDGHLFIDLFADGGTIEFAPATVEATQTMSLIDNPWQWVAFTNPVEQYIVDDPQKYVLTFNQGGTINIQADCNTAVGTYTFDGSSLKIQLGGITLVACPEGSQGDDFIKHLGFAASFFFQDGHLFIDLFADGRTMEFAPLQDASGATQGAPQVKVSQELIDKLANMSYTGLFPDQAVTLVDGVYAYDDGSSARPFVRLLETSITTVDLNGDGKRDAVLLLIVRRPLKGNSAPYHLDTECQEKSRSESHPVSCKRRLVTDNSSLALILL